MPNRVFAFGEALCWVTPTGLNSQNIGYIRSYTLDRTPVTLEDGRRSFYDDALTIESPWVDDDVTAIFQATGPFSAFIQWTNQDDGRLASVSVTSAILTSAKKHASLADIAEVFSFGFRARSLL